MPVIHLHSYMTPPPHESDDNIFVIRCSNSDFPRHYDGTAIIMADSFHPCPCNPYLNILGGFGGHKSIITAALECLAGGDTRKIDSALHQALKLGCVLCTEF